MSYDDEVRQAVARGDWGPYWDKSLDTIPDGTLKIDGKFVRVEIASGTDYTGKTHYTPLYRIVDDADA